MLGSAEGSAPTCWSGAVTAELPAGEADPLGLQWGPGPIHGLPKAVLPSAGSKDGPVATAGPGTAHRGQDSKTHLARGQAADGDHPLAFLKRNCAGLC